MSESSHDIDATARNNLARILRGIDLVGLKAVGDSVGKDHTTICKMRSDGRFDELATMLAACRQRIVDVDSICISKKDFLALKTLADRGLHDLASEIGEE